MDGVGTPIIGRPRPLPRHDTPNPAYHPHTLNYEEPVSCGTRQGVAGVVWVSCSARQGVAGVVWVSRGAREGAAVWR